MERQKALEKSHTHTNPGHYYIIYICIYTCVHQQSRQLKTNPTFLLNAYHPYPLSTNKKKTIDSKTFAASVPSTLCMYLVCMYDTRPRSTFNSSDYDRIHRKKIPNQEVSVILHTPTPRSPADTNLKPKKRTHSPAINQIRPQNNVLHILVLLNRSTSPSIQYFDIHKSMQCMTPTAKTNEP